MKKSNTYRIITVAIGILVAMVIAVTLWIRTPADSSHMPVPSRPQASLGATAKKVVDTTLQLFSQIRGQQ